MLRENPRSDATVDGKPHHWEITHWCKLHFSLHYLNFSTLDFQKWWHLEYVTAQVSWESKKIWLWIQPVEENKQFCLVWFSSNWKLCCSFRENRLVLLYYPNTQLWVNIWWKYISEIWISHRILELGIFVYLTIPIDYEDNYYKCIIKMIMRQLFKFVENSMTNAL